GIRDYKVTGVQTCALPISDYLSMVNKKFIADLMPTHPIYIPLLPKEAQEAIGQVQEQTRPAVKILEEEGFKVSGMVDIFDAGPRSEERRVGKECSTRGSGN